MRLEPEQDVRRAFESPILLNTDAAIYVALLVQRAPTSPDEGGSFQVSLEPDLPGRGRRLHQLITFGISSDRFPFINSGNTIRSTATRVHDDEVVFCVAKVLVGAQNTETFLRVYRKERRLIPSSPVRGPLLGLPARGHTSPTRFGSHRVREPPGLRTNYGLVRPGTA